MKPFVTLARTDTPDGSGLTLHEHDGEHFIMLEGEPLMSTKATASEKVLAQVGCAALPTPANPRILIGGLGLGFTLRRVLEMSGPKAAVHVVELMPEVVDWNREHLQEINGSLLDDPRVELEVADLHDVLADSPEQHYDSILLDVDNGAAPMTQRQNVRLYRRSGIDRISDRLKPGGRAAFWSADRDPPFADRLSKAGFAVEMHPAKAYDQARKARHAIYVAVRRK